jgi:hypothetical protein
MQKTQTKQTEVIANNNYKRRKLLRNEKYYNCNSNNSIKLLMNVI